MSESLGYYSGSLMFQQVADLLNLPIDHINFAVASLTCLLLGYPYRTWLAPDKCSATTRHLMQILFGLPIAYFAFGSQVNHVVAQSVVCYLFMTHLQDGVMEKVVTGVAFVYLCLIHIYRQYYDYGGFVMDISGPLMVNVARVSSIAYGLRDGRVKDESRLSPMKRQYKITEMPSVLAYFSYIFSFHNFMCGPFAFFPDYQAFIDGSNFSLVTKQDISNGNTVKGEVCHPSPARHVLVRLVVFVLTTGVIVVIGPYYTVAFHAEQFATYSFGYRVFYMIICTTVIRNKYYCAWKISEAVNLNAGFGFNGYDEHGAPKWNLLDNIRIRKIEFSTSFKMVIDNWNIQSLHWLRYIVYERYPSRGLVFVVSAFWHGFYGGYYIMFLTLALFAEAGRVIRRNVRPHFQGSSQARALYEVITFVGKTVALGYSTFPFVLLDTWPSIRCYRDVYFFLHIVVILIILFFKFVKLPPPSNTKSAAQVSPTTVMKPTTANGSSRSSVTGPGTANGTESSSHVTPFEKKVS